MNKRGASAERIFLSGVVAYADTYPLHEKLRQCEAMFNIAQSGTGTMEQADKARIEHLELMVQILDHLNRRTDAIAGRGGTLSPKEATDHLMVMGHLLQMPATDADQTANVGGYRFVFDKALALQKERYEQSESKLGYAGKDLLRPEATTGRRRTPDRPTTVVRGAVAGFPRRHGRT
jgi:hypothetical protein